MSVQPPRACKPSAPNTSRRPSTMLRQSRFGSLNPSMHTLIAVGQGFRGYPLSDRETQPLTLTLSRTGRDLPTQGGLDPE